MEVLNGSTTLEANRTALEYAQKYGIQPLGASDAHCLSQLGKYVTWLPEEPKDLESFIRALRSGTCRPAIWEDGAFRVVDTFFYRAAANFAAALLITSQCGLPLVNRR